MKISDFAKAAGVTPSRIRFYEARGLLQGAARLSNGYRDYGTDDLKMLRLIARARALGFTLAEIARFMGSPVEQRRRSSNLTKLVEAKLAQVEAHLGDVQQRRATLVEILEHLRAGEDPL